MMTISQLIAQTRKSNITINELEIVIGHIISQNKEFVFAHPDFIINQKQLLAYKKAIFLLEKHYPLAYILGYKEFYGENYIVNESTLIPRPETELIIDHFLRRTQTFVDNSINILEVGTGTGCISISLIKNIMKKNLNILAIDISTEALKVAELNKKRLLSLEQQSFLKFKRIDFLKEKTGTKKNQFDIIISNPPYIPEEEYKKLDTNIFFEPKNALTPDSTGLVFYNKIAELLNDNPKFKICMLEIHSPLINEVKNIFTNYAIEIINDYASQPRLIIISPQ